MKWLRSDLPSVPELSPLSELSPLACGPSSLLIAEAVSSPSLAATPSAASDVVAAVVVAASASGSGANEPPDLRIRSMAMSAWRSSERLMETTDRSPVMTMTVKKLNPATMMNLRRRRLMPRAFIAPPAVPSRRRPRQS